MAEQGSVTIGPRPRTWLLLIAAAVLGFTLYVWAPDPLALIDAGARPSKGIAAIKWGGMIIAVIALARMFGLRRIGAGPDGVTVRTLLKRTRHDWSALKSADLEGKPLAWWLRFEGASVELPRRDYAAADIARLAEVVRAHQAAGGTAS